MSVFISHSTKDKAIIDLLVRYFLNIGLNNNQIFCSSSPGHGVQSEISKDIYNAIDNSNVAILYISRNYLESHYCMQESGILLTKKDILIIPIIDTEFDLGHSFGFLTSNYLQYRLSDSDSVFKMADEIIEAFKITVKHSWIATVSNDLIKTYLRINGHIVDNQKNELDVLIQSKKMTDEEVLVLFYFHNTHELMLNPSSVFFQYWLYRMKLSYKLSDTTVELLKGLGFIEEVVSLESGSIGIKIKANHLRDIINISSTSYNIINDSISIFKIPDSKYRDNFIEYFLASYENMTLYLIIKYIKERSKKSLSGAWKTRYELDEISAWEKENLYLDELSTHYPEVVNILLSHEFLTPSEYTSYNNVKTYKIDSTITNLLECMSDASFRTICEEIDKSSVSLLSSL